MGSPATGAFGVPSATPTATAPPPSGGSTWGALTNGALPTSLGSGGGSFWGSFTDPLGLRSSLTNLGTGLVKGLVSPLVNAGYGLASAATGDFGSAATSFREAGQGVGDFGGAALLGGESLATDVALPFGGTGGLSSVLSHDVFQPFNHWLAGRDPADSTWNFTLSPEMAQQLYNKGKGLAPVDAWTAAQTQGIGGAVVQTAAQAAMFAAPVAGVTATMAGYADGAALAAEEAGATVDAAAYAAKADRFQSVTDAILKATHPIDTPATALAGELTEAGHLTAGQVLENVAHPFTFVGTRTADLLAEMRAQAFPADLPVHPEVAPDGTQYSPFSPNPNATPEALAAAQEAVVPHDLLVATREAMAPTQAAAEAMAQSADATHASLLSELSAANAPPDTTRLYRAGPNGDFWSTNPETRAVGETVTPERMQHVDVPNARLAELATNRAGEYNLGEAQDLQQVAVEHAPKVEPQVEPRKYAVGKGQPVGPEERGAMDATLRLETAAARETVKPPLYVFDELGRRLNMPTPEWAQQVARNLPDSVNRLIGRLGANFIDTVRYRNLYRNAMQAMETAQNVARSSPGMREAQAAARDIMGPIIGRDKASAVIGQEIHARLNGEALLSEWTKAHAGLTPSDVQSEALRTAARGGYQGITDEMLAKLTPEQASSLQQHLNAAAIAFKTEAATTLQTLLASRLGAKGLEAAILSPDEVPMTAEQLRLYRRSERDLRMAAKAREYIPGETARREADAARADATSARWHGVVDTLRAKLGLTLQTVDDLYKGIPKGLEEDAAAAIALAVQTVAQEGGALVDVGAGKVLHPTNGIHVPLSQQFDIPLEQWATDGAQAVHEAIFNPKAPAGRTYDPQALWGGQDANLSLNLATGVDGSQHVIGNLSMHTINGDAMQPWQAYIIGGAHEAAGGFDFATGKPFAMPLDQNEQVLLMHYAADARNVNSGLSKWAQQRSDVIRENNLNITPNQLNAEMMSNLWLDRIMTDRNQQWKQGDIFKTEMAYAKGEPTLGYLAQQILGSNERPSSLAQEKFISDQAAAYARRQHLPEPKPVDLNAITSPIRGRLVAEAYDKAVSDPADPSVVQAYAAFAKDISKQWAFLKRQGIQVEFVDRQGTGAYDSEDALFHDIKSGHLFVDRTGPGEQHLMPSMNKIIDHAPDGTPITTNDAFRAVHDYFGHSAAGNRFDRNGEDIAWRLHAQMFSKAAHPALFTETVGQNSYLNFHPSNVEAALAGGIASFPEQKAVVLPQAMQQPEWLPSMEEATRQLSISANRRVGTDEMQALLQLYAHQLRHEQTWGLLQADATHAHAVVQALQEASEAGRAPVVNNLTAFDQWTDAKGAKFDPAKMAAAIAVGDFLGAHNIIDRYVASQKNDVFSGAGGSHDFASPLSTNELYSKFGDRTRGVTLENPNKLGNIMMRLYSTADVTTLLHEDLHAFRLHAPGDEVAQLSETYPHIQDATLTPARVADEERFVSDFMNYLHLRSVGQPYGGPLSTLFSDVVDTMAQHYNAGLSTQSGQAVPDTIVNYWDSIFNHDMQAPNQVDDPLSAQYAPQPRGVNPLQQRGESDAAFAQRVRQYGEARGQSQVLQQRIADTQARARQADAFANKMHGLILEPERSEIVAQKLESRATRTLSKLADELQNAAGNQVPRAWRPYMDAVNALREEAKLDPALAPLLDEIPQNFAAAMQHAASLGFEPTYMPELTWDMAQKYMYRHLQLGETVDAAGMRQENLGVLNRAGVVDRSLESLGAGAVMAMKELLTSKLVGFTEENYARQWAPGTPLPDGWRAWEPTRNAIITGRRIEDNATVAVNSNKIIPEAVFNALKSMQKPALDLPFRFLWKGAPIAVWKHLLLTFSPTWYLKHFIGAVTLSTIEGVRLSDWKTAYQQWKTDTLPDVVRGRTIYNTIDEQLGTAGSNLQRGGAAYLPNLTRGEGLRNLEPDIVRSEGYKVVAHEITDHMRNVVKTVDGMSRAAVYARTLRVGGSPELAASRAYEAIGDFGRLSPIERSMVTQLITFYAFQKAMFRILLRLPAEHPIVTGMLMQLGQMHEQYLKEQLHGSLPSAYFGSDFINGHLVKLDKLNPLVDSVNLTSPDGIAASANPFVRLLAQDALHSPSYGATASMDANGNLVPAPSLGQSILGTYTGAVPGLGKALGPDMLNVVSGLSDKQYQSLIKRITKAQTAEATVAAGGYLVTDANKGTAAAATPAGPFGVASAAKGSVSTGSGPFGVAGSNRKARAPRSGVSSFKIRAPRATRTRSLRPPRPRASHSLGHIRRPSLTSSFRSRTR